VFAPWAARAFTLLALLVFLSTAFRAGWTRLNTDFPNYYTAAVAVRHGEPLRRFYDWTWFARQMNYAGIENQLGAYTPQTPLTMLPMVGLTGLAPLQAKRVWLVINLILLAGVVGLLARTSGIRGEYIAALLFCGYRSLDSNFLFGQYYVFLLFLIALIFYCIQQRRDTAGGFLSGVTFGLKLYTGPLLLYFAAKRRWGCVLGMLTGTAGMGAVAIAIFGWSDVAYYLTHVLPRTLEGGSIDPYNPGVPTISTLLRKLLMREPGLNPHPQFDAPWLFFFARTAVQLGLVVFATLGIAAKNDLDSRRDFAWFAITLVMLSTSTASYTYILLLAPIALLLRNASRWKAMCLVVSYILLNSSLQPVWIFPKVWLLLLLFCVVGAEYWRFVRVSWGIAAAISIMLVSLADAQIHMRSYLREPGRRYSPLAVEPGALFAGYPAVTREGLFYQAMGDYRQGINRYVIRWLHDGQNGAFVFPGNALNPSADADGAIHFELVTGRRSTFLRFDPSSGATVAEPAPIPESFGSRISPDGKWAVLNVSTATSEELWLKNLASGATEQLAGGNCNNSSPVWELDSSAVVFASDCGRAFGLPALYRAPQRILTSY